MSDRLAAAKAKAAARRAAREGKPATPEREEEEPKEEATVSPLRVRAASRGADVRSAMMAAKARSIRETAKEEKLKRREVEEQKKEEILELARKNKRLSGIMNKMPSPQELENSMKSQYSTQRKQVDESREKELDEERKKKVAKRREEAKKRQEELFKRLEEKKKQEEEKRQALLKQQRAEEEEKQRIESEKQEERRKRRQDIQKEKEKQANEAYRAQRKAEEEREALAKAQEKVRSGTSIDEKVMELQEGKKTNSTIDEEGQRAKEERRLQLIEERERERQNTHSDSHLDFRSVLRKSGSRKKKMSASDQGARTTTKETVDSSCNTLEPDIEEEKEELENIHEEVEAVESPDAVAGEHALTSDGCRTDGEGKQLLEDTSSSAVAVEDETAEEEDDDDDDVLEIMKELQTDVQEIQEREEKKPEEEEEQSGEPSPMKEENQLQANVEKAEETSSTKVEKAYNETPKKDKVSPSKEKKKDKQKKSTKEKGERAALTKSMPVVRRKQVKDSTTPKKEFADEALAAKDQDSGRTQMKRKRSKSRKEKREKCSEAENTAESKEEGKVKTKVDGEDRQRTFARKRSRSVSAMSSIRKKNTATEEDNAEARIQKAMEEWRRMKSGVESESPAVQEDGFARTQKSKRRSPTLLVRGRGNTCSTTPSPSPSSEPKPKESKVTLIVNLSPRSPPPKEEASRQKREEVISQVKALQEKVHNLKLQIKKLTPLHDAVLKEKRELQEDIDGCTEKLAQLEVEDEELEQQHVNISLKHQMITALCDKDGKAMDELERDLKEKVLTLTAHTKELKEELEAGVQEQQRMEKEVIFLRGNRANEEEERHQWENKSVAARTKLRTLQQEENQLKHETHLITNEEQALEKEVAALKEKIAIEKEFLSKVSVTDSQLRQAYDALYRQNRALLSFNATLKEELGDAKAKLAAQSALVDEYIEDDEEIDFENRPHIITEEEKGCKDVDEGDQFYDGGEEEDEEEEDVGPYAKSPKHGSPLHNDTMMIQLLKGRRHAFDDDGPESDWDGE